MKQILPSSTPPPPTPPPGAIPAATLVIMRPRELEDADEILMVKRANSMVFAAGAVVFPGGRVEPDDHIVADRHGFGDKEGEGAARVAALRETLEETGLAIGWPGLKDEETHAVRQALLGGELLSKMLVSRSEYLELDALVPFARWCPNFKETRTFDTRFFAVEAPDYRHELSVEAAEHSHIFWASAAETLAMADRDEVSVIFPTRRNLERLAKAPAFQSFREHARQFPARLITPWIEQRDDASYLCIPEDLGYPTISERLEHIRRG